jgi:hypothetical protein
MKLVDHNRLATVTRLDKGSHKPGAQMCAMEAAAYIAGEPWSDYPECVCPVIATFMRSWNDALPDAERTTLLLPLIAKTIGTRGSDRLAERRALMATDWLVRVNTPAWLRLGGLTVHADALATLPEITSFAPIPSSAIAAANSAANSAAWDVTRAAAWATVNSAALDAVLDAATAAAWAAARATVNSAALDAVLDAATAAAWAAASQKLASTKAELQASAVLLVERMCALQDEKAVA